MLVYAPSEYECVNVAIFFFVAFHVPEVKKS